MGTEPGWRSLRFRVPCAASDCCSALLWEFGAEGVEERYDALDVGDEGPALSGAPGDWAPPPPEPGIWVDVIGSFAPHPEQDTEAVADAIRSILRAVDVEVIEVEHGAIPDEDWHAKWREGFHSFDLCDGVRVRPSWERPEDPLAPGELLLDPGMAFGTGTHTTTRACAELIVRALAERAGGSVLDVGTGTAILAMVAERHGAGRIVAVDVDPLAVDVARANLEANGLMGRIELRPGSAADHDGAFDIVVANLLAPVLRSIAVDLVARLAAGGVLIWSGVLHDQHEGVTAAFQALGLREVEACGDEHWVAVRMTR